MFKRENWKTEKIIQGLSRIPTYQAHFMICMAMLGGVLFTVGFGQSSSRFEAYIDKVPEPFLLMLLGFLGFWLFMPLPYIIYLAKELQSTKAKVEELANRKA